MEVYRRSQGQEGLPKWFSSPRRVTAACGALAKLVLYLPGKGFPAWRLLRHFISSLLAREVLGALKGNVS